ncbi:MAG: aromatic acid exporter family protein [Tissierellales bacterium]|jgi:uncharacterized membrane protein YgaE (UPF0421/DUF939 family)|nr:aromatic acid exporter family protein [Tissierellales bacterium]
MPKIGMRNIKTAVSVALCIALYQLLKRPYPFYACIAAVICMRNTHVDTIKVGKDRMIGTMTGGFIGYIFYRFISYSSIGIGIGISLVIYTLNLMKKQASVAIACIVFIAVMTNLKGQLPHVYAINRVLDTFIGIIIAAIINNYLDKLPFLRNLDSNVKKIS